MYQWLLNTIAGALCHPWQWWDVSEEVTERLISSILDMASDSHFRGMDGSFGPLFVGSGPLRRRLSLMGS